MKGKWSLLTSALEREEDAEKEEEEVEKHRQRDRLRKMTTSSRQECEVDSSSSSMISLSLLETDTQSKHTALKQTQCQTELLLKGCEGRENGVNGSKMLLTLLPTQVRLLPFRLAFTGAITGQGPCLKFRMTQNGCCRVELCYQTEENEEEAKRAGTDMEIFFYYRNLKIFRHKLHFSFLWSLFALKLMYFSHYMQLQILALDFKVY